VFKLLTLECALFTIIIILLWFTNKQHNHIVYLEDTVKIQGEAIAQQAFLIECQKIYIDAANKQTPKTFLPFYKKYD
jgi:hypothetical protein